MAYQILQRIPHGLRTVIGYALIAVTTLGASRWARSWGDTGSIETKSAAFVILLTLALCLVRYLFHTDGKGSPTSSLATLSACIITSIAALPKPYRIYWLSSSIPLFLSFGSIAGFACVAIGLIGFKETDKNDRFGTRCRNLVTGLIPAELRAIITQEIKIIYYALFRWHPTKDDKKFITFSYHKKSIDYISFWALFGTSLIEIPIIHVVIAHWSSFYAWIATDLGLFTSLYLLGCAKSLSLSPICIDDETVTIRLGLFAACVVPVSAIATITHSKQPRIKEIRLKRLTLLEIPNIKITLHDKENYKLNKNIKIITFHIDEPNDFCKIILQKMQNRSQ